MIIRRNKFYIASSRPDLENRILKPGIPINSLGIRKDFPRIALYTSPDDALSGYLLGAKVTEPTRYYIYQPLGIDYDFLHEASISTVPYSMAVPEYWYTREIRLRKLAEVEIQGEESEIPYRQGPRSTVRKLYRYRWRELGYRKKLN